MPCIVAERPHRRQSCPLPLPSATDNLLAMYAVARLLQLAALIILPLSILAQLSQAITLGQMLQFLVVGVCLFTIGYLLQTFTGKK
jgi:hypothetical protein